MCHALILIDLIILVSWEHSASSDVWTMTVSFTLPRALVLVDLIILINWGPSVSSDVRTREVRLHLVPRFGPGTFDYLDRTAIPRRLRWMNTVSERRGLTLCYTLIIDLAVWVDQKHPMFSDIRTLPIEDIPCVMLESWQTCPSEEAGSVHFFQKHDHDIRNGKISPCVV